MTHHADPGATALVKTGHAHNPYLDAKHGGIDDEVAALIKDCIGVGGFRVCNQVLLPRHATPEVNRLQVVHLRLPSLQLVGGCQGFIVCAPQLAALEAEDSYAPTSQAQHALYIAKPRKIKEDAVS